jgi:hypothetical protein
VFNRIRDVNFPTIYTRLDKYSVKKLACRSDERPPFKIFVVAGLLAYKQNRCVR